MLVRSRRYVLGPVIVIGLLFQSVALLLAGEITRHRLPEPEMLLVANINLFFFFVLMFSRAMIAAIDVLYGRGDVDFLLASPIPPGRVLAVRIIGVGASVAAPWLLLGGVLANGLAVYGQYWALSVYPMLLAEGLLVAALAFALVVMLVGTTGPAAARRAGHTLALLMGVVIFALGQAPRFMGPALLTRFWQAFTPSPGAHGPALIFARAMLGQTMPLALSLGLSLAIFGLVWVTLDRRFANGSISAAAYRPAGATRRQGASFRAGPVSAVFMKNLRLLTRFPGVVSQTVYRSLTLVPVAMILAGRLRTSGGVEVAVPLLVFLSGQLGLFFISVLVGADDAPDLGASAPVARAFLRRAALGAAAYATLLLLAGPVLLVLWRARSLAPVLLVCMALVLASNLAVGIRLPIPLVRAFFGKGQTGTVLGLVVGVAVSSAWAFAAWLLVD
ncbi:hypothetical protein [Acidocella sp.]|uniref:hypothetical protein n=1 Tax=Acidocella sp. TaxID=50710 RepID=UPI002F3E940F